MHDECLTRDKPWSKAFAKELNDIIILMNTSIQAPSPDKDKDKVWLLMTPAAINGSVAKADTIQEAFNELMNPDLTTIKQKSRADWVKRTGNSPASVDKYKSH